MNSGALRHLVTLENSTPAADGDGSYVPVYAELSPARVWASIEPATARDLERVAAGTVISSATHLLRCWYHPQITTQTRITYGSRLFSVVGVQNVEERSRELVIAAVEVVP